MNRRNCNHLSAVEPTYWPRNYNKLPDLLVFFIHKGITKNYIQIESNHELSSDHTCNCNFTHSCDKQITDNYAGYIRNALEQLSHIHWRPQYYEHKNKNTDELDQAAQYFTILIHEAAR